MKAIVRLFYDWYGKNLRNSKYRWALILGGLFYLISPIDISPDVFPILGWLDDGIIISMLVSEFSEQLLNYRNRRRESPDLEETAIEVETL